MRHSRPEQYLQLLVWLLLTCMAGQAWAFRTEPKNSPVSTLLRQQAEQVLQRNATLEQPLLHLDANERLLELNLKTDISDLENPAKPTLPAETIRIEQISAKFAPNSSLRELHSGRLIESFRSESGPPRAEAAWGLFKLNYVPVERERELLKAEAESTDSLSGLASMAVLAQSGAFEYWPQLIGYLASANQAEGALAFEAVAGAATFPPGAASELESVFRSMPAAAIPAPLAGAMYVRASAEQHALLEPQMEAMATSPDPVERKIAAEAFALVGAAPALPALQGLLNDGDLQVQTAAANAILRIGRRVPASMGALDWLVIVVYMLSMVGIGLFYSKSNKTAEDYMLGGRAIKSWLLGVSMFASLLSTLTYLSYPGEMIQHGPMYLMELFAFPFIFLFIGWLVIPFIMRLRVTSAYEILEYRFGLSLRMLGSSYFLALRLMWMATILYATTDKVLIPLAGISKDATPLVCAILGAVTVFYTSIGGLRAVVVTDAVQSVILLGAAILTIVTITVALGGFSWFPTSYASHWETPQFGFQLDSRMTGGWIILMAFSWFIATTSSDQIAIQRFLSTRDLKGARTVLATTLLSISLTICFLGLVGCALLAYFKANPQFLADGQTIQLNGDRLFPHYIASGLPHGLTGLVVAGLLAAAMSSLSAGINSASSVVMADFIQRLGNRELNGAQSRRTLVMTSWSLGAIVVLCSMFVNVVPGNLFEVVNRVANLVVAPLFMLFFMAMFIPWANLVGTWAASLSALAVAIMIAYWEVFTGRPGPSFVWIMPASIGVGALTGMIVSLIPLGPKALTGISQILQREITDQPMGEL